MNDLVFLKKDTRTYAVVTSVILAIALLMLVIIGLISGNFLNISVIGSCVVLFIAALFMGSMQIRVFSNYKSQKKYLCADGIFYICLTILVAIASIVFVFAKNAKVDLRYFIFVFILAFAVWKMIIAVLGFKNKYYNAFLELIIAVLWLVSGSAVLMTLFENTEVTGQYLLCVSNYVLGAVTIIYILYSYIFKSPDFLITEVGGDYTDVYSITVPGQDGEQAVTTYFDGKTGAIITLPVDENGDVVGDVARADDTVALYCVTKTEMYSITSVAEDGSVSAAQTKLFDITDMTVESVSGEHVVMVSTSTGETGVYDFSGNLVKAVAPGAIGVVIDGYIVEIDDINNFCALYRLEDGKQILDFSDELIMSV